MNDPAEHHRANALDHTLRGDWLAAVDEWTRVIALLPESAAAYRGRAAARERACDSAGAVADFEKAAVLADAVWTRAMGGHVREHQDRRLHAWGFCCCGGGHQGPQMESDSYHKRHYCDRAEDTSTHTLEENPDNVQAWFDRASVRHCKRNWDGVVADCTRAVQLDPDFASAYSLRGSAYEKKGELAQAVADWTRALALCPQDVMAYSLRSLAYEALGEEDKAQADRVRAFELCNLPKQP